MTEPSATSRTRIEESEAMVECFVRMLYEAPEYYEIQRPLFRFETDDDAYQWTFGEDFDAEDVHDRGYEDVDVVSFDPDGLTYSSGGYYVSAYTQHHRDPFRVTIRRETTEDEARTFGASDIEVDVERMVIIRD